MAYVSSTFNTTNTYIKYRLVVDLISQDVNSNTSTINVQLQAWRTNTGYETYGSGTASVNVEGSQYNQGISSSQKITYNSYTVLYNANHTISHNADGTKSPNIGGYFSIASVVSGGWNYFSFSLPTIPRASTVSATNADIGSATSINIGRYSTSFTHTLKYSFGSLSGTIANGVETSYGWTVPTSFYAEIPNSVSGTCTITCETYNGATLIGTSQTTFSATVNEAVNKPDISATISDSNTTTATLTGNNQNMVKYFSNAAFSITATPKNSATIVSRSITCEGLSSTSVSGTLTAVESGTFVVATIDSRGFSNSVTYNRTLVDYVRLTFNPVVYRPAPTTGEVALTFNGNYFNSTFGSVANQLGETAGSYRIYWRSREKGTSTWSAYTTVNVTRSGNTYNNGASPISLGTGFTYTKAYEFDFNVLDKLTTLTVPVQSVSQGIPVFNWDRENFNVNVPVTIDGDLQVTGKIFGAGDTVPIGTTTAWMTNTPPTNWLICDGSAVSRSTYTDLFSVIGTTYGSGNGSTTFNLPNMKGRVIVGKDSSQTEFDVLGETGGHKLLQAHGHEVRVNSFAGDLGIAISQGGGDGSWYGVQDYPEASYHYTNPYGSASSFYASSTGGGNAQNLQPYIVSNYIIKAQFVDGVAPEGGQVINNLDSSSSVDALSANMGNLLKTNLNDCFLPVEWGWFKLTSLSNLADGATRTTLPITKVAGSFTVSSNYITLTKGYLYEVNMDFAYDNNGASGIAYITLLNVSTSADLMWRQNEKLSNAMTSSPESGCVGFGIIDLTSAPSDIQAKCHVPLSTNTGSLSPSIGGLYITKYKKITI